MWWNENHSFHSETKKLELVGPGDLGQKGLNLHHIWC